MLLLFAISHILPARARQSDPGLAQLNYAIGQVGLTIIALVYVLVTVWQR